jgi:triosephosphate isomerase (TIM)
VTPSTPPLRRLVVGNWKMHRTPSETAPFLAKLEPRLAALTKSCDIAVALPFTSLHAAAGVLNGSRIALGAQNVHWEEEGPFTGEVSPKMLQEIGCRYVIVGHSERREHFGETDRRVNRKARAVLFWKMTPIVCVGEKADERAAGRAFDVVDAQVKRALANIKLHEDQTLVMAYEPVWAIGTGHNATPEQASEIHRLIRTELEKLYGAERGAALRVIYGGSVTASNAASLFSAPRIDGALVGGASLDVDSYSSICAAAAGA